MPSGQQLGEANLDKLEAWLATQTMEDLRQLIHRGKLNKREIAKGCGIGRSAIDQNPKITIRLQELETSLREQGVLPPLTPKAILDKAKPKEYDNKASSRIMDSNRLAQMERKVIEQQAEIQLLRQQLERFRDLSEVLGELGVIPR